MSAIFGGIKIPTTGRDWELYTVAGDPKAVKAAAEDLTAATKAAITEFKARLGELTAPKLIGEVYNKHIDPVMRTHRKAGAWDTEPRYHAAQALCDAAKLAVYGTTEGYHPEFADCI